MPSGENPDEREDEQLAAEYEDHDAASDKNPDDREDAQLAAESSTSEEDHDASSTAREDQSDASRASTPLCEAAALLERARQICIPEMNINVNQTRYQVVRQCADKLGWGISEAGRGAWTISWHDCGGITAESSISTLNSLQTINHFPGMSKICQKCKLGLTIGRLAGAMPDLFDFHPKTWSLPKERESLRRWFQLEFASRKQRPVLIVKPDGGCQGNGIFLSNDLKDLDDLQGLSAVQQYLPSPYLINGFKFDLRIYVVVTSCMPSLRAFQHTEGLVRFCTVKYERPRRENLGNRYMHLTNYAVNKHNANYKDMADVHDDASSPEPGAADASKWSLDQLYQYLSERGHDVAETKRQIQDIIVKTLLSIQPSLAQDYRACFGKEGASQAGTKQGFRCFEILGFDIMLDAGLRPWVIEVNHSPSLHCDAPLDQRVKEQVVRESLVLGCIDAEDLLAGKARPRPTTLAEQRDRMIELLAKRRGPAASGAAQPVPECADADAQPQSGGRVSQQRVASPECPDVSICKVVGEEAASSPKSDQSSETSEHNDDEAGPGASGAGPSGLSNQAVADEDALLQDLRTAYEDAHCGGFRRILPYDPKQPEADAYARIEAFRPPLMKENPVTMRRRMIIEKERQQLEAERERVRTMIGNRPVWGGGGTALASRNLRAEATEEEVQRKRAAKRRQFEQKLALAAAAGKPAPLPRVASLRPFQRKFKSINPDGSACEPSPRGERDSSAASGRANVQNRTRVQMRIQTLQFGGF